ncbi:DUF3306 domain-containing protein [Inmirania thermothiophila]|uniref:Uncharacterized protein DUF3306 n=1 Tax=Inmirania thermothiophila TaxID=1750597 RepID=A0A3N1Y0G8_9GAMM|nr:DUF3306 domain-containing protein [Inmirania thermothiophila]ROR32329.1 uncharacterized protein DUF3306 [Inmirania thermothiophila]
MRSNGNAPGRGAPVGGDETFLHRWARRKRAARQGAAPQPASPPAEAPRRPAPTDTELPDPETLPPDSERFRDYLSPRVSEALRRRALRRLFHLPQFQVADGLDDYCEDFTGFDPLGELVTHEMRHMLARLGGDGRQAADDAGPVRRREAAEPVAQEEGPLRAGQADAPPGGGAGEGAA